MQTQEEPVGANTAAGVREPLLVVQGATKSYPGVTALDDVDFSVEAGEVRALLGANGAGKSTLIKIIAGVEKPDSGVVTMNGQELTSGAVGSADGAGVATVYQELSIIPDLTVAENISLGQWPKSRGVVNYEVMYSEARRVLERVGADYIDVRATVASLSLAEMQMVEIARALGRNPRLLILDEPTSALSSEEAELVINMATNIAKTGVGVIYVSHRMDEIRRVADSITIMRNGTIVETAPTSEMSTETVVSLMMGHSDARKKLDFTNDLESAPVVLSIQNLSIPPKVDDVSFNLRAGEVLGIAGVLGAGKSEILRAIAGFDPPAAGRAVVGDKTITNFTPKRMRSLGIGMTPEDRKKEGSVPFLGIDENMVMSWFSGVSRHGVLRRRRIESVTSDLRDRLNVKVAHLSDEISSLSGGNQQKAIIGRWLHAGSQILLLDDPTRGVDVDAKGQIYALIRSLATEGVAVVFVSSEIEELPLVCDRVLVLRGGQLVGEMNQPEVTAPELMKLAMASDVQAD